jgi:hypothetical protein
MKTFLDYLNEDVVPAALVTNGTISLDNEDTRASVNMALAKVTADSSITPYIALNRISKALSYFSIILPKRIYLEGAKGVEVHEILQFGDKMGMTNQGEFIRDVPGKFYLFMQYGMNSPMGYGGQLAYPSMGGTFRVFAKVVDKEELDKLISMAELALAEECDAEMQQKRAKMLAPHDTMNDVTSDPKKVGNKKAVADSNKGIKEDAGGFIRGLFTGGNADTNKNKTQQAVQDTAQSTANKASGGMLGSLTDKLSVPGAKAQTVKEEQIDELWEPITGHAKKGSNERKRKAVQMALGRKHKGEEGWNDKINPQNAALRMGRALQKKGVTKEETINEISQKLALKAMKASEKRSDDEWEADAAYDRLSDWKTHDARAHRLRGHMKRKFGKKKIKTDGEDHLKDYDGYSGRQGVHTVNTHGKRAGLPPKEQVNRLKNNIRYSLGKHRKPNLPEETQINEVGDTTRGKLALKSYARKADKWVDKETGRLSLDYDKKPRDIGKELDKIDRRIGYSKKAKRMAEETQLDELSRGTVARYKKAAVDDKKSAESSAETSHAHRKNRALPLAKRNAFHDEEKWLKGIAKKREKGIAMADKRLEEKLTKGMSAADVIHDFVHSDDPKFKGKSVKERQKMALGAYYGMHPEKSSKE